VLEGAGPLIALESRVVPTVLYGPDLNPQFGASTVFNEVPTTTGAVTTLNMNAVVSVSPSAPGPVVVTYLTWQNATADSTPTGGAHNLVGQVPTVVQTTTLYPGDRLTFSAPEGPEGTYVNPDDLSMDPTGSQFDVEVRPASDPNPADFVGVGGIIAYDPNLPAVTPPVQPCMTAAVAVDTELPGVTSLAQSKQAHGTVTLP
jgi:hypothetical protein